MGHNDIKYVLFEPEFVGWGKGLLGAVSDAAKFGVPLALKDQKTLDVVKRIYPAIECILIE